MLRALYRDASRMVVQGETDILSAQTMAPMSNIFARSCHWAHRHALGIVFQDRSATTALRTSGCGAREIDAVGARDWCSSIRASVPGNDSMAAKDCSGFIPYSLASEYGKPQP
jgi:hypothetical protein